MRGGYRYTALKIIPSSAVETPIVGHRKDRCILLDNVSSLLWPNFNSVHFKVPISPISHSRALTHGIVKNPVGEAQSMRDAIILARLLALQVQRPPSTIFN